MLEREKYKLSTYETIEVLHRGAESIVELVQCTLDDKKYVKKTYQSDKRDIYSRLKQIECKYIPKIYEVFFGEDTIIIEEYVEGKTLDVLVNESKNFSKKEIRKMLSTLVEAISALHNNDLVHRDIKPSNVIVKESGEAVLIDYSIARVYDVQKVEDTELMGTQGYAAPEQYGFSQSDYRTDIYGLGATMSLVVTKKNATRTFRKIIKKCSEFDPTRRFQTIEKIKYMIWLKTIQKVLSLGIACVLVFSLLLHYGPLGYNDRPVDYNCTYRLTWLHDNVEVPSLIIPEDGVYKTKISLNGGLEKTRIKVVKDGKRLKITINGKETFVFEDTTEDYIEYYPNGDYFSEILFYDMEGDGQLEIIPIIANAYADIQRFSHLIYENYSVAWAIYYDGDSYKVASGEIYYEEGVFDIGHPAGWLYSGFRPDGSAGNYIIKDGVIMFCDILEGIQ